LAAELKESFEVDAELLSGERGDFEVIVDGEKVFSKKILSRFPEPGEITQLIRL
jgi:selT/selW/selH-like putative selenoprotein